jgi:hypothetical protein
MITVRLIRWVERRPRVGNAILGVVAMLLLLGIVRLLLMVVSNDQF